MSTDTEPKYLDITDIRGGNATMTGKGAEWETSAETRAAFEAIPDCGDEKAEFLVDMRDDDGDILDTRRITSATYRRVVGEEPATLEENEAFDREYWRKARIEHKASKVARG